MTEQPTVDALARDVVNAYLSPTAAIVRALLDDQLTDALERLTDAYRDAA